MWAPSQPEGIAGDGKLTSLARLFPPSALFALGFLGAIAQVAYSEGLMFGPNIETMSVARTLAHTGSFANPYTAAPTGPTAHLPPLYPALLAVVLLVFGDTASTTVPLVLMAACFHGLHTALLPAVAARFIGRRDAGVIAALLSAVVPVFQLQPHWDSATTAAGVLGFCLLAEWAFPLGPASHRRVSVAGLCLGLLLLLNPSVILVALPLLAWLCLRRGLPLRMPLVTVLAAALVCLPWVIRNYLVVGQVGFIRSNLGLELHVSNNDCAQSSLRLNLGSGCMNGTHPDRSTEEASSLRQLGEPAYNRSRLALALKWAQTHRAAFWRLTARRVVEFWLPHPYGFQPFAYGIWLITAVSFVGLYRMSRDRAPVAAFFHSVLLIYPLLYYLVQSDMRYRYPVFWVSLIAAGYGLARPRWFSPTPERAGEKR